MSAQMIENRMFLHRFRDASVVRFHSRPELGRHLGRGHHFPGCFGSHRGARPQRLFQLGFKCTGELVGAPSSASSTSRCPPLVGRSQRNRSTPCRSTIRAMAGGSCGRPGAAAEAPAGQQTAGRSGRDYSIPAAGRSVLDELDFGDSVMARTYPGGEAPGVPRHSDPAARGVGDRQGILCARPAHASERADKPFVAVNCGSLPEMLLQSELFGRVNGVGTQTDDERAGSCRPTRHAVSGRRR